MSQHKASHLSLTCWRGVVRLSHSHVGSCSQESLRVRQACSSPSLGGEAQVTSLFLLSSPSLFFSFPLPLLGLPGALEATRCKELMTSAPDKCELHGDRSGLLLCSRLLPSVHLHTAEKRDGPVSDFLLFFSLCCVSHLVV